MQPAEQGLYAGRLAGGQAHLRLEYQAQLTARNHVGQRIFGFDAELMLLGQIVAEQAMLPAAA